MIPRLQKDQIIRSFDKKKSVVIMGPRQVGKSTLLHDIFKDDDNVLWLNGDDADVRAIFENFSATKMRLMLGKRNTLVIDEAQRINDIGLFIKIMVDQFDGLKVAATGSSSFELAAKINESLTGRKREFRLLPLSFREMVDYTNLLEEKRMLHHRMQFGYYPEVVVNEGDEIEILRELTDSYIYKDIIALDAVKKPDHLSKLVKALAYQIGSQISLSELSRLVGVDVKTVARYIDILEKCFIVFRLGSFSRNRRNELKSSSKIYFWDLGIRNSVIGNFASIENRAPEERGALWENFAIAERLKRNNINRFYGSVWFWRTTNRAEVDYIEEEDAHLSAFEFKYNPRSKANSPVAFRNSYPDTSFEVITPDNIESFLL